MMTTINYIRQRTRPSSAVKGLVLGVAVVILCILQNTTNNNQQLRRYLLNDTTLRRLYGSKTIDLFNKLHEGSNYHVDESEEDYNAAASKAVDGKEEDNNTTTAISSSIQKYTITDALKEASIFRRTFGILIYNPQTDKFILFSTGSWSNFARKGRNAIRDFVYLLRHEFPERFTSTSAEFVICVGSDDYPHVITSKLPHLNGVAPVLQFGSSFRDTIVYPNMIAMPMPGGDLHMGCFLHWSVSEKTTVCERLTTMVDDYNVGNEWNSLIPQLIWRGTDFGFLGFITPTLSQPDPIKIVRRHLSENDEDANEDDVRRNAIQALNEQIDTLVPRWKGAALTADAELQVEGTNDLPWANIKFSSYNWKGKKPTVGSHQYEPWESVGIAVGEGMSPSELAKYKYHIDLGGGGGTTWGGTIEKLSMPGLLYHHMTPTKDYIHDYLTPWKHYIPVSENLQDLKKKFDWAEAHPQEAKRIADAGTDFMRELGTPQGFGKLYDDVFVEPLKRVIEAYQPVSTTHPDKSLMDMLNDNVLSVNPIMECDGLVDLIDCKRL